MSSLPAASGQGKRTAWVAGAVWIRRRRCHGSLEVGGKRRKQQVAGYSQRGGWSWPTRAARCGRRACVPRRWQPPPPVMPIGVEPGWISSCPGAAPQRRRDHEVKEPWRTAVCSGEPRRSPLDVPPVDLQVGAQAGGRGRRGPGACCRRELVSAVALPRAGSGGRHARWHSGRSHRPGSAVGAALGADTAWIRRRAAHGSRQCSNLSPGHGEWRRSWSDGAVAARCQAAAALQRRCGVSVDPAI